MIINNILLIVNKMNTIAIKKDYGIILELVIANNFININQEIKLKSLSKSFNCFIHFKIKQYKNDLLAKIQYQNIKTYTYYEGTIITTNNENNLNYIIKPKCAICGLLILKITAIYKYKNFLCDKHLDEKFITFTTAMKKYKIPKKILQNNIVRWKHNHRNRTIYFKQHIKFLYLLLNYEKV